MELAMNTALDSHGAFSRWSKRSWENLSHQCRSKLTKSWWKGVHSHSNFCSSLKHSKWAKATHLAFKIPDPWASEDTCHLSLEQTNAQNLRVVSFIIREEIALCRCYCVNTLNCSMKISCRTLIRLVGKWYCLLKTSAKPFPVVLSGFTVRIISACAKSSFPCHIFKIVRLTENMRLKKLL